MEIGGDPGYGSKGESAHGKEGKFPRTQNEPGAMRFLVNTIPI
jgi:hypothetical protein